MKINECVSFSKEYPEKFMWEHLVDPTTVNIVSTLCGYLDRDLHMPDGPDRAEIIGLRKALNIIAEITDW